MWFLGNAGQSSQGQDGEKVPAKAALAAIWLADLKKLLLIRRNKLAQSMGVPASLMEDMPPQPNNVIQQSGINGWLAAAGVLAGVLAGALLFKGGTAPQQGPLDSNYKVLFYDAQGNPIPVQHISARPKQ